MRETSYPHCGLPLVVYYKSVVVLDLNSSESVVLDPASRLDSNSWN